MDLLCRIVYALFFVNSLREIFSYSLFKIKYIYLMLLFMEFSQERCGNTKCHMRMLTGTYTYKVFMYVFWFNEKKKIFSFMNIFCLNVLFIIYTMRSSMQYISQERYCSYSYVSTVFNRSYIITTMLFCDDIYSWS